MMITCVPMYVAACNQLTNGEYNPLKLNPLNPGNLWKSKETPQELVEFQIFFGFVKLCELLNKKVCDVRGQYKKNSSVGKNGSTTNQPATMSGGQSSNNSSQSNIDFNLNLKPYQQILKKIDDNNACSNFAHQGWVDKNGNAYTCFSPTDQKNK